ncbi:MAG: hypothetical protein ACK56F_06635, partial [bacterium]
LANPTTELRTEIAGGTAIQSAERPHQGVNEGVPEFDNGPDSQARSEVGSDPAEEGLGGQERDSRKRGQ